MPLYNSDSHSRHPNVCNKQQFLSQTTCVLRMSLSSDTVPIHSTSSGLSCQGTPVRLACSCQSTQLAWLAGTGAQGGATNTHTPAIHCQQALSVRSSLARLRTLSTASEALDPGKRRLFLLADQPGKPTDQEKSKYERYTQSITMVYPWDILTDKLRDIFLQR